MPNEHQDIEAAFLSQLNNFAHQGYTFGNGLELRRGTIDDPDAKGTQRESFDAYVNGLEAGYKHGYDEVPTGVGKTAGFLARIKCYLQAKEETASDKRVLIVVPSTDLVVQTSKAIAKFMPDLAPIIEADDDTGKEIDWEKSQIGVQYGKHKHADKKPDVLITTYQSLIRDTNNTKYPPNEYGFVIYDEGHNITAPRFGEGVDKFKDSIQLAVTATPEYSDSKTVSKKLPYRYYHLSLADAIKRGDLCDVDPILIKTNFTIDEAKVRHFLESQGGKPLTKGQMEKLLNQESRNIAAIKTYLLGADQQTGERYFGQLGMVFAGGIAHTEDYCRQFEAVLQKPEYKGLHDLLKEDGIAPVAYVHSKTPKVGIPLIIDGEKRNYTEDEVKELHRKGKILLLVSDGKLKLGSDFPRDSIEIDLVDRLSVVDATQRFGRGFRLDNPDPDYNYPGDPEKRCKAFNLVDENTYDLYKDRPQMLPIYAAEILEGAEFREPQQRKHLLKRFSKKIPDIDDSLEQSGFEVITNIDRVRAVSNKYKERKDKLDLPEKSDDDLTLSDALPKALGVKANNTKYMQWRIKTEKDYEAGKITKVGQYSVQKVSTNALCLNVKALPALAAELGIQFIIGGLPQKTNQWCSPEETKKLPNGGSCFVIDTVKELIECYDQKIAGIQNIEHNGQIIQLQQMQSGSLRPICIAVNDWNEVIKASNLLPVKTDQWLKPEETWKMAGGNKKSVREVTKYLRDHYDKKTAGIQNMEYNGQIIRVQRMNNNTSHPVCIDRDDWDKVTIASGEGVLSGLQNKSDNWLSFTDAKKLPDGNRQSVNEAFEKLSELYDDNKQGVQNIDYKDQVIRTQRMRTNFGKDLMCIDKEDWDALKKAAGVLPKKTDEWVMASEYNSMQFGSKKDVKEVLESIISLYNTEKSGIQGINYQGEIIHIQQMSSRKFSPICIKKADWGAVLNLAGHKLLSEKTTDWLTKGDVEQMQGGWNKHIQAALEEVRGSYDTQESGIQIIRHKGLDLHAQQMYSSGKAPICIARDDWPVLQRSLLDKPLKDSIQQKSISPDSPHIQDRSGRSRGAAES